MDWLFNFMYDLLALPCKLIRHDGALAWLHEMIYRLAKVA